jgi:hypothetical protein
VLPFLFEAAQQRSSGQICLCRSSPLPASNSVYEPIESSNCGLRGGVYHQLSSICRTPLGFARFTWYRARVELM